MLVSIVIPCYNSEHTIGEVVELAIEEFEKLDKYECEFVLVNDYSRDGTWKAIEALSDKHPNVKGINLAKNFGQHNAIMAAMSQAEGELIVGMDDDMQNHPSQIPQFLAAIYQGCILCGLIQTNSRYFELFQTSGGLDAEITDYSFQRYYHSGNFPELTPELRAIIIDRSFVQEEGIRINHIPIRGGHLFWSEDISVLLDQYQDIREQQEELTTRNRLLQKTYQKEAERRKAEEQNRLLNMIQNQTAGQLELLSQLMDELERTESREQYDWILGKIVVVGTYLKRRKNLVLTQYTSDRNLLTMEDLRQSLAESCDSLKLCRIRAAYYVEKGNVQLNAEDILKCYDTFEWLVERLSDVMQSVFYRVSQIDDALRISVHIVSETDLGVLMSERPELKVQQEDENEWFVSCIVLRKEDIR